MRRITRALLAYLDGKDNTLILIATGAGVALLILIKLFDVITKTLTP